MANDNNSILQQIFSLIFFLLVIAYFAGYDPIVERVQPYVDEIGTVISDFIEDDREKEEVKTEEIDIEAMRQKKEKVEYDNLLRFPDEYEGVIIEEVGKVSQRLSDNTYRVYITEGEYRWEDDVYIDIRDEKSRGKLEEIGRLLEDDKIKFLGELRGEKSGRSILGTRRVIPEVDVYDFKLIEKRR